MLAFLNKEEKKKRKKPQQQTNLIFKKKNPITKISNLLILNLRKDNLEGSKV